MVIRVVVVAILLAGCTSQASEVDDARGDVESFCEIVVPLLSEQVTFPGPIRNQMRRVGRAANEHLSEGGRTAIVNSIESLDEDLELALADEGAGWSTHRVVDNVASTCGTDNEMIGWSVQP